MDSLFKVSFLGLCVSGCLMFGGTALAEGDADGQPRTVPDADTLIKHCWAISEEKRDSGITSEMRLGALDSALCLKEEIITQALALIDETSITRDELSDLLDGINASYGRLYWLAFNENKACHPSCGTMNHPLHNAYVAKAYERILRDLVRLRIEYGV